MEPAKAEMGYRNYILEASCISISNQKGLGKGFRKGALPGQHYLCTYRRLLSLTVHVELLKAFVLSPEINGLSIIIRLFASNDLPQVSSSLLGGKGTA